MVNSVTTYRVETTALEDGTIIVEGLPVHAGDKVEIVVIHHEAGVETTRSYSLRELPVVYTDPFGSVAEDDWGALQ
jgi:hypothetical protein